MPAENLADLEDRHGSPLLSDSTVATGSSVGRHPPYTGHLVNGGVYLTPSGGKQANNSTGHSSGHDSASSASSNVALITPSSNYTKRINTTSASNSKPATAAKPSMPQVYRKESMSLNSDSKPVSNMLNDSLNLRPVSIHGNLIHNQSIYANTVPLAKIGANQKNLNTSKSTTETSPTQSGTTRTTLMDSSTSNHELHSTQISPIGRTFRYTHNASSNNVLSPATPSTVIKKYQHNNAAASENNIPRLHNSTVFNASNVSSNTSQRESSRADHHNYVNTSALSSASQNGGLNLTKRLNERLNASLVPANVSRFMSASKEAGVKGMISSLALLCMVSLLLALLSLTLLLKLSPRESGLAAYRENKVVQEVSLALCCLTLSLNLCCLLVCSIQFLFAVKLVKSSQGRARTTKYLKKASFTRSCAVGGFFFSIPVFLTGIILYTFLHFNSIDSSAAIFTSIFIGVAIVFCGAAVVHNVFIWQREKMKAVKNSKSDSKSREVQRSASSAAQSRKAQNIQHQLNKSVKSANTVANGALPPATLDLSSGTATANNISKALELSTLV